MTFLPVDYTCFPPPGYLFVNINAYNRGFPAQFLITQWWGQYPALQTTLYVFASFQLILAVAGLLMSIGRKIQDNTDLTTFAFHKLLPILFSFWQLALGGLIIFLPTQWLSNVTMGMILFHAWGEFFALILRFLVVQDKVTPHSLKQYYFWIITFGILTGVPFMLGSNPYIQGLITAIPVLPADFLNLVLAPYLNIKWVIEHPTSKTSEKVSEILAGIMSVLHVAWFYGQGIIACTAGVYAGAQYFIAFQVINTVVFAAVIISWGLTITAYKEWSPVVEFSQLCFCFFFLHTPQEEKGTDEPFLGSVTLSDGGKTDV